MADGRAICVAVRPGVGELVVDPLGFIRGKDSSVRPQPGQTPIQTAFEGERSLDGVKAAARSNQDPELLTGRSSANVSSRV